MLPNFTNDFLKKADRTRLWKTAGGLLYGETAIFTLVSMAEKKGVRDFGREKKGIQFEGGGGGVLD